MRRRVVVGVCLLAVLGGVAVQSYVGPAPPTPSPADPETPAPGAYGFQRAHALGVTGEGVAVGVLDVTGYDLASPVLDGRVAGARSFDPGNRVHNGGHNRHGTKVAETVATLAPDADLYLANFDTPEGYARAVEWLLARDVDAIVAPFTVYGKPGDGTSAVARAVARAVEAGVVVVASAGNLGAGHWVGPHRPADGGRLAFASNRTRNYLSPGGGRTVAWLSWDDPDLDFQLRLYREADDGPARVATSAPYAGDDVPNERIAADLPPGRYFLVVVGPARPTNATVRIESPTHRFEVARPRGSVAPPATAEGAIAVGAYNRSAGAVERFSSRGPAADGRRALDVVADSHVWADPEAGFRGSSVSAAYVAGVAALLLDAAPSLGPAAVERALGETATDVGPPGPDVHAGHGRVDALAAVRLVGGNASS